jgi:hypothetical protein
MEQEICENKENEQDNNNNNSDLKLLERLHGQSLEMTQLERNIWETVAKTVKLVNVEYPPAANNIPLEIQQSLNTFRKMLHKSSAKVRVIAIFSREHGVLRRL